MAFGPYVKSDAISFHEAAHAVVAHVCGGVVESVSIGEHGITEIDWATPDTDGELKTLFAGIIAEETYEQHCEPPAIDTDSWSGFALDDADINGICYRRLGSDSNEVDDLRTQMLLEARTILAANWRVVDKLAATLRVNLVIEGESLDQILSETQKV